MIDIKSLMIDKNKENNGIWVDYEGVSLCIASIDRQEFVEAREGLLKVFVQEIRNGELSGQDITELITPAIADHILLDWKNLGENGVEVKYSREKALEYLKRPELKDMLNHVLSVASQRFRYRQKLVEEGIKN